jgi:hypothetical protein
MASPSEGIDDLIATTPGWQGRPSPSFEGSFTTLTLKCAVGRTTAPTADLVAM